MANPLAGANIHWTFATAPARPPRPTNLISKKPAASMDFSFSVPAMAQTGT
jgi:hypothetical protein